MFCSPHFPILFFDNASIGWLTDLGDFLPSRVWVGISIRRGGLIIILGAIRSLSIVAIARLLLTKTILIKAGLRIRLPIGCWRDRWWSNDDVVSAVRVRDV